MHRYICGQHVRYAEDGSHGHYWPATTNPNWIAGYYINELFPPNRREPQYRIYNAERTDERIVGEGEICKDQKRGAPRSTSEFFLLWAQMNVTSAGDAKAGWTSFVPALEAELERKNAENHQLRQSIGILRDRDATALREGDRLRAQHLPRQGLSW
ncbi:hypothetical protein [Methylobacterium dankookense]|uniref:hypothetical protein n=1 Tax=Methylobacterium dankookense TaxID=560405 RepID=UPI00119D7242|nr:hypothetical protein [Methylobacterium dankookense]